MIEQLKTIRDGLENFTEPYLQKALTALAQLEAMVGEQEPVAWQRRMRPTWGNGKAPWGPWEECSEGQAKDCWRTPLLHDWAYEARALCTAAPVAQQPSKATLEKLRAWEANGELIDRAWQVLQSQEQEIMRFEKMLAEELAQQPQAEPDMRKVCEALGFDPTNHHNAAKCPYCRGQQPQAEAVPAWTTEQITAVAQPIAMAIAENCRTAPQLVFPHLFLGLKDLLTSTATQQTEAVPPDVVRDADRYRWLRLRYDGEHACDLLFEPDPYWGPKNGGDLDAEIDAAIAQQKGGV